MWRRSSASSVKCCSLYLLQEAEQELLAGGVGGVEARDGFVQHVEVEAAAGGGQSSQRTQDKPRLLTGHGLLDLLHMLTDICRGRNTGVYCLLSIIPPQSFSDSVHKPYVTGGRIVCKRRRLTLFLRKHPHLGVFEPVYAALTCQLSPYFCLTSMLEGLRSDYRVLAGVAADTKINGKQIGRAHV